MACWRYDDHISNAIDNIYLNLLKAYKLYAIIIREFYDMR